MVKYGSENQPPKLSCMNVWYENMASALRGQSRCNRWDPNGYEIQERREMLTRVCYRSFHSD